MFQPTLVPAYGRDYKSQKEVLAALNANTDFLCEPHGSYVNLSGFPPEWRNISVRFKKLGSQIIINVIGGKAVAGYK